MSTALGPITQAADRLRSGGVVAFPTETVYGLGADALNADAIRRVYELKGRPSFNPLIVHVSGPEMTQRVVAPGAWDARAACLSRTFWPGPLSIVVPRSPQLPEIVTAGAPTVAVRCPDHPVALALLFGFGGPLVGPSANLSGHVSPTLANHVREAFTPDDVLVLEGGPCRGGIESTVVSLAGDRPRILRLGLITPDDISRVLGESADVVESPSERSARNGALESPGQLARHYAPRTAARLVGENALSDALRTLSPRKAVVLSRRLITLDTPHVLVHMPADPEPYAAALYSSLRHADEQGADEILIELPPADGHLWRAIADRLVRATTA